MTFAYYLLNIIQGIAEFLPISSSGHLIITEWVYGINEKGFEAFLHLPTALAILFVFWQAYINLLKDRKLWIPFLCAIIPAGVIGFVFGDYIDAIFYSPFVVGINQILWGIVLIWTGTRTEEELGGTITDWKKLTWFQSLKIGLMQIIALIPGTSRSGITTLAGIWTGLTPQASASFSFIAGAPLIGAASLVGLIKVIKDSTMVTTLGVPTVLLGMLVSFILGLVFMKLFTSKHTLTVMKFSGIYRIILGILIFAWLS